MGRAASARAPCGRVWSRAGAAAARHCALRAAVGLLLAVACGALDLSSFDRSFPGLPDAALQLEGAVAACNQSGAAALSFEGLPGGFPSLPAGTSAAVVVDCSLQAWSAMATAAGAPFSFAGSSATVAAFDVSVTDDSRLPVTTNVTLSASVTSAAGDIVLQLHDAFSSPYVATTRTLAFAGPDVAFSVAYTALPNCSGTSSAVGELSIDGLPAGLKALSNIAVNANVPCSMDGFTASLEADAVGELQSLELTYASMHSPLVSVSAVFGDAAVIDQPSATGVALALNVSGAYPCVPGQVPTAASGVLYVNLPDEGLTPPPLQVDALVYCLPPNGTGMHVVATTAVGALAYGDFSASGVTVTVVSGLYLDAASNEPTRFVNASFTGAATLDDMNFTLTVTANRTDALDFAAVVTMAASTPLMSAGTLHVAATFVLAYPCDPGVGQYATATLQLSGMDYGLPDTSLDATLLAACTLRAWSLSLDAALPGLPALHLGPGLNFQLSAPGLQLTYDKLQPVYLNFSLTEALPSGTISLTFRLPVDPVLGPVALGGSFPTVPLLGFCNELMAALGINVDPFSIPGAPVDLGDFSDELSSFQLTAVTVLFVLGPRFAIHGTGFASVLGLNTVANIALLAPHGELGWTTFNAVSVDMRNPPSLSFQPSELAAALNYLVNAVGTLSAMSFIRCSAPQLNLALPTLAPTLVTGGVTLPSVSAGFSLALFASSALPALGPLLDALGALGLPTPHANAPLLVPINGPDVFRLALELQIPDGGIPMGFGQLQGLDLFLAYDLTATPPSYSQGLGLDPLQITFGTGSGAYTVQVSADLMLVETAGAVNFQLDTLVSGDPWVNPFGVSPQIEVVWPASLELGASLSLAGLDPTLLGFSGAFVSPANEAYGTNMSLDATVIADLVDPTQSCAQFTATDVSLGRLLYLLGAEGPILQVLNAMSVDLFRIGSNPTPATIVPANGDPIAPGLTAEAFNVSFFGLFDVEQLSVAVSTTTPPSLTAAAQITPLSLGPLTICASSGNPANSGPSLNVFFAPPTNLSSLNSSSSVAVNGAIVLLGAEADFSLAASLNGFAATAQLLFGSYGFFNFSYDVIAPPSIWSMGPTSMVEAIMAMGLCSYGVILPGGCSIESFVFSVAAAFDIGDFLGQLFVDAAQPLVQALLSALQDAQTALQAAEAALADAQQVLSSMSAQLSAAQASLVSLSGNVDCLSNEVASAQQSYDAYAAICSMAACTLTVSLCQSCVTVDAGVIISAVTNEADAVSNTLSSEANTALSAIGSAAASAAAAASQATAAVDTYVSGVASQMASDWNSVKSTFEQASTVTSGVSNLVPTGQVANDASAVANQANDVASRLVNSFHARLRSADAAVSSEVQGVASEASSNLNSIGNAFASLSNSSDTSSSTSSSMSTPFSSWRGRRLHAARELLQSDSATLCATTPCGASWTPEWSSATQFPGSTWNGAAWTEACDPFVQASACVQAAFYSSEQAAASAALATAQDTLAAAQAAGTAALAAASSEITDAEDAVNQAQSAVSAAAAAVSSAAASVGAIPGLAFGEDAFLATLFELTSFDGTMQYSNTAGSFQAAVSFTFMGSSDYELSLNFSTSVDQVTDVIDAWVNQELSSIISAGGSPLRRRSLLSVPAPPLTRALSHGRSVAAALEGSRRAAAVAIMNSTLRWGLNRAAVLPMLTGLGSLGPELDARYAQFMGAMERVAPALGPLRGNVTVGQVATWAKTNLTKAFGPAVLTQAGGRLFELGPTCLASVSAAGLSCELRTALLTHACILSAGTGAPALCTDFWLALARVDATCSRVLRSDGCSAEAQQVLTNFLACPASCARAVLEEVSPACGGVLSVRNFMPSRGATAHNCTSAALSALADHCQSTPYARPPRACFDGVFSALSSAVQADLAAAWRSEVDPAGALPAGSSLTAGMKGFLHLNGEQLYGALSPDLCSMDVVSLALSSNNIFGSIPPCLLLGGTGADITTIVLHDNALGGTVSMIGPFVRSLSLGTNARLGGDVGAALKYAASLSHLDVSNTNVRGTLAVIPSLKRLQSINVANTKMTDAANASVADLLADAPALVAYTIGGTSLDTRSMRPAAPRIARGTLVIDTPISSFCSRCPYSSWGQDCTSLSCADAAMVARQRCALESYLNASVAASAPHSVTIVHIKPLNLYTVITYAVDSAPAVTPSVVAAMLAYNSSAAQRSQCTSSLGGSPPAPVVLSKAIADCPNGRLGASCNYFCAHGWADHDASPVAVNFLTAFSSSDDDSTAPTYNYTASGGANCTVAQAVANPTCRIAAAPAAGFHVAAGTARRTASIGALNCSAACFQVTATMKPTCDAWLNAVSSNATAYSACVALLDAANVTCSSGVVGPCPAAKLSTASAICGSDDVACFAARAAPYAQLLAGQSTPVQHVPVRSTPPPLVAPRVPPPAVNDSIASVAAAVAKQLPHCVPPPCPGACHAPLQVALGACTAFLYDAKQQSGCVAALGTARAACASATSCYAAVATGFELIVNNSAGAAAAALADAGNSTLGVVLTLNVTGVDPGAWSANAVAQLAALWSAKLGVSPAAVSVQPAALALGVGRRLLAYAVTLNVTVTTDSPANAYGLRDAMGSSSPASLGAIMRRAGIHAAGVTASQVNVVTLSLPRPPPPPQATQPRPDTLNDKGVGVATLALVATTLAVLLALGTVHLRRVRRGPAAASPLGVAAAEAAGGVDGDSKEFGTETRSAVLLQHASDSLRLRHERTVAAGSAV